MLKDLRCNLSNVFRLQSIEFLSACLAIDRTD